MRHLITTRRINIISTLLVCGFFLMGAAFQYGGIKHDLVSTVTSSGSIILTNASTQVQRLTGSTAQKVHLPDARSLRVGYWYIVSNDSTQTASVYNYNSELVGTISAGNSAPFYLTSLTTTGGPWDLQPGNGSSGGGSGGTTAAFSFGGASENSVCTGTPCTTYRSKPSGLVITRSTTGQYAVDFGSYFTNKPICAGVTYGAGFSVIRVESHATANTMTFTHFTSGAAADGTAEIVCVESE